MAARKLRKFRGNRNYHYQGEQRFDIFDIPTLRVMLLRSFEKGKECILNAIFLF